MVAASAAAMSTAACMSAAAGARRATAAAAGSAPVTVMNTPLPVTGSVNAAVTGTVGITGTPSVNATITNSSVPVSGTVAVSSLPTVNLGGNVTVGNTSANPVLTQATDNPASQPFQFFNTTESFPGFSFTVPGHKELVIEYLYIACFSPTNIQPTFAFQLNTAAGGFAGIYKFAPTASTVNGGGFLSTNQTVRIYADPGTEVGISLIGASIGSPITSCETTVSGHLVSPIS